MIPKRAGRCFRASTASFPALFGDRCGGFLCFFLAAAPATSAGGDAWRKTFEADTLPGHRPLALGFDESGVAWWLESRQETDGRRLGAIRRQSAIDSNEAATFEDDLSLRTDHCALLAWRDRCYLAAAPAIRMIDLGSDGRTTVTELSTASFEMTADEGGFTGLSLGPDGRLYGGFFGGVIRTGQAAWKDSGVVFRFEPDGRGFEVIHRGLRRPGAPVFSELGDAWLLDAAGVPGNTGRWVPLLDGGRGHDGRPLTSTGVVLPEAATEPGTGQPLWLARGPEGGSTRVETSTGESTSTLLEAGGDREIVDLVSDWNGRPHVLIHRAAGEGRVGRLEVHALGASIPRPEARQRLATIQKSFDGATAEGAGILVPFVTDPERRIRWLAAWALTRDKDGLPLLLKAMRDGGEPARHAALAAIGVLARLGHPLIVPGDDREFSPIPDTELARSASEILGGFLRHPSGLLRAQALNLLGSAKRPASLIPFGGMLADPDPRVRDATLLTGGRLKQAAMLDLLPSGDDAPALDPARLADALDGIHAPGQLLFYSRHQDPRLRLAAAEVLRRHRHEHLGHFVFDSDPAIAAAVVMGIDQGQLESLFPVVAKRVDRGLPEDWPAEAKQAAKRCAERAR